MTEATLLRKLADLRARVARVRELLPDDVETFLAHEAARDDLGDLLQLAAAVA